MAQITTVELFDDLDGSKATETVAFGLDGVSMEIDLNIKNAKAIRKALAEFVAAARHVKPASPIVTGRAPRSATTSKPRPGRATGGPSPKEVRAWAESQGIEVSTRGRLSESVVAQYTAALT